MKSILKEFKLVSPKALTISSAIMLMIWRVTESEHMLGTKCKQVNTQATLVGFSFHRLWPRPSIISTTFTVDLDLGFTHFATTISMKETSLIMHALASKSCYCKLLSISLLRPIFDKPSYIKFSIVHTHTETQTDIWVNYWILEIINYAYPLQFAL